MVSPTTFCSEIEPCIFIPRIKSLPKGVIPLAGANFALDGNLLRRTLEIEVLPDIPRGLGKICWPFNDDKGAMFVFLQSWPYNNHCEYISRIKARSRRELSVWKFNVLFSSENPFTSFKNVAQLCVLRTKLRMFYNVFEGLILKLLQNQIPTKFYPLKMISKLLLHFSRLIEPFRLLKILIEKEWSVPFVNQF